MIWHSRPLSFSLWAIDPSDVFSRAKWLSFEYMRCGYTRRSVASCILTRDTANTGAQLWSVCKLERLSAAMVACSIINGASICPIQRIFSITCLARDSCSWVAGASPLGLIQSNILWKFSRECICSWHTMMLKSFFWVISQPMSDNYRRPNLPTSNLEERKRSNLFILS